MIASSQFLKFYLAGVALVALSACHQTAATSTDKTPVNSGPSPAPSALMTPAIEPSVAAPAASVSPAP